MARQVFSLMGQVAFCLAFAFLSNLYADEPQDDNSNHGVYSGNIGDNIDLFLGTLSLGQIDLSLPGRAGLDLNISRFYTSAIFGRKEVDADDSSSGSWGAARQPGYMGDGWNILVGRIWDSTVYYGDGTSERIFPNEGAGSSIYPCRTLSGNRLTADLDTLVMLNGTKYMYSGCQCYFGPPSCDDSLRFDLCCADTVTDSAALATFGGRYLNRIEDVHGNEINISYEGPFIQTITDAVGRHVYFRYSNSNFSTPDSILTNRLVALKYLNWEGDTLTISYGYNGTGQLSKVMYPRGDSLMYDYTNRIYYSGGYHVTAGNTRVLSKVTTTRGGVVEYKYWLMKEQREKDIFWGKKAPDTDPFSYINHWSVWERTVGMTDTTTFEYANGDFGDLYEEFVRHKTTLTSSLGKETEYYFSVNTDIVNWLDPNQEPLSGYSQWTICNKGFAPGALMWTRVVSDSSGCDGWFSDRHLWYTAVEIRDDKIGPYLVLPAKYHTEECGGYTFCTKWNPRQYCTASYQPDTADVEVLRLDTLTGTVLWKMTYIDDDNWTIDSVTSYDYDTTLNTFAILGRQVTNLIDGDSSSVLVEYYYNDDLTLVDSVETTKGSNSVVVSYTWDSYGNLETETNENGYTTEYVYDTSTHSLLAGTIKQVGSSSSDTMWVSHADYWENSGIPKWEAGADSFKTYFEYDDYNRVIRTKRPLELSAGSKRYYNSANNSIVDSVSTFSSYWRVTYEMYDGFGREVSHAMKMGAYDYTDSTVYGTAGLVEKTFRPWDTDGSPSDSTLFYYDSFGRQVRSVSTVEGGDTVYNTATYDDARTVETVDYSGRRVKTVSDGFGNVIKTYSNYDSGYSDSLLTKYGAFGRAVRVTPPAGDDFHDSTVYNGFGRVWKTYNVDEGWKEFYYDRAGNVRLSEDAAGTWSYFKYDGLNRVIEEGITKQSVSTPDSVWEDHDFPAAAACSLRTIYKYDSYDAVVIDSFITAPGHGALHNPRGRLTQVSDPSGYTYFFYDGRGRLAKKVSYIDGEIDYRTIRYTFSPGDMIDTLFYPNVNRNVHDTLVNKYYDWGWQKAVVGYTGDGTENDMLYNPDGSLSELTLRNDAITPLTIEFAYDGLGRITKEYVTGSGSEPRRFRRGYDYDGSDLETVWNLDYSGAKQNRLNIYSYDNLGRLSASLDSNKAVARTFDYYYDANGNRDSMVVNGTNTPYYYWNNTNRLLSTSSGDTNWVYNNNGCITTDSAKEIDIFYDYRNLIRMMTQVTEVLDSQSNPVTDTVLYTYDYSGKRVKKSYIRRRWGPCETGGTKVEGPDSLGKDDKGGECLNRYVTDYFYYYDRGRLAAIGERRGYTDPGMFHDWHFLVYAGGKPICQVKLDTPNQESYLVTDYQNTVRNVYSFGAGDHFDQAYWYLPFGSLDSTYTVLRPQAEEPMLTYNFKELDATLGEDLYYYGARYYDAAIGRFGSPDPIRSYLNPYSYAGNNPIRYVDVAGLIGMPSGGGTVALNTGTFGLQMDDPFESWNATMDILKTPMTSFLEELVFTRALTDDEETTIRDIAAELNEAFHRWGEKAGLSDFHYEMLLEDLDIGLIRVDRRLASKYGKYRDKRPVPGPYWHARSSERISIDETSAMFLNSPTLDELGVLTVLHEVGHQVSRRLHGTFPKGKDPYGYATEMMCYRASKARRLGPDNPIWDQLDPSGEAGDAVNAMYYLYDSYKRDRTGLTHLKKLLESWFPNGPW